MQPSKPAPYPADTRAKGWRFELDLEQITQSDTWALAAEIPMAQHALLMMWAVAWQQVPCGAMPADAALLRAKLKVPPKMWPPMADVVVRGWWMADDGRLYHPLLTAQVLEMLESRARGWRRHRDFVIARDGGFCKYCGCVSNLSLDHVIPRSRGGTDDPTNLVIACRPCNSSKGARTPEEWSGRR